jgi:hypothetical protein
MRQTHLKAGIQMSIRYAAERRPQSEHVLEIIDSSISTLIPTKHSQRSFVSALVDFYFNRAIELIAIGQFPSAYVELHALLEESAIRLLPKRVGTKGRPEIVADLIKRKTLSEIAPQYEKLGLWTHTDVKFARKLSQIRNGVSHRNFTLLERYVGRTTQLHELDAFKFNLENSANALARVVDLTVKIAKVHKRRRKNP